MKASALQDIRIMIHSLDEPIRIWGQEGMTYSRVNNKSREGSTSKGVFTFSNHRPVGPLVLGYTGFCFEEVKFE